ncbi:Epoxide hydrolase A [Paraconexibacter sp. AEG42_29]|uniref:Epoxide hydrolase A n=1 Tax=Paraconexibacter sp. AEG42_29 TaxID=2997339 RepID=A0AAU7AVN5_9ACTN
MSTPERLRIDANGLGFGALAWGDPAAPLALLVHGYPDSAWTWRHLGPYLAERGWRAVAPFTRGYAPTDLAPDDSYLVADLRDDVLALHTALGGDERSVLVGHDWGAVAAYAAMEADPNRFRAYVTLAVPPPPAILKPMTTRATARMAVRQTAMSWYFVFNQLPGAARAQDRVIPRLWRDWSPGHDAREDLTRVFEALSGPGRRRAAVRYYRNNLQRGLKATFTIRPKAPVLYLHGEGDGCMQADIATCFPDALPAGSRYERVPGVGHFLQLEDPERVNALVSDWIGSPTGADRPDPGVDAAI